MAQTYLLYGEDELVSMAARVEPAVGNWAKQWLGRSDVAVHCATATFALSDKSDWWHAKPTSGWGLFIRKPSGFTKELTRAVFGDLPKTAGLGDTPTPLVGDCLSELIADLAAGALQEITSTPDQSRPRLIMQAPTAEQFDLGSGAIVATVQCDGITLSILIPGALAESALRAKAAPKSAPASAPLAGALPLIQSKPVALTAILGQAQIDIGTLQSIAIGDVIRFETTVDQPATLLTEDGQVLCHGYVGSRNQFKSLQLHR